MNIDDIDKIRCNVIRSVSNFTNDELRQLIKEVNSDNIFNKPSENADKLFKLYSNDEWHIGLDRFTDIRQIIELEITQRIEKDYM